MRYFSLRRRMLAKQWQMLLLLLDFGCFSPKDKLLITNVFPPNLFLCFFWLYYLIVLKSFFVVLWNPSHHFDVHLAGFCKTFQPNGPLPSRILSAAKNSKVAIIKTKSATIPFFSSRPLSSSLFPFLLSSFREFLRKVS